MQPQKIKNLINRLPPEEKADLLKKLEKDGDISQDDSRQMSDRVQKMTDESVAEIDKTLSAKESEIMQV